MKLHCPQTHTKIEVRWKSPPHAALSADQTSMPLYAYFTGKPQSHYSPTKGVHDVPGVKGRTTRYPCPTRSSIYNTPACLRSLLHSLLALSILSWLPRKLAVLFPPTNLIFVSICAAEMSLLSLLRPRYPPIFAEMLLTTNLPNFETATLLVEIYVLLVSRLLGHRILLCVADLAYTSLVKTLRQHNRHYSSLRYG